MISLIISTIGAPFLLDSLQSLRCPPAETLIILDSVGRASSDLNVTFPLEILKYELAERFPWAQLHATHPLDPWGVMNQCYNVGCHLSTQPFVMCTHDDITYADFDYFGEITPVLRELERREFDVDGRRTLGVVLPEWEVLNQVLVPKVPEGTWCLTQATTPVSHVILKEALAQFGGFDEHFGVWYDAQLEAEINRRNWWSVLLPTPKIRHTSNRTYRTNNWGDSFSANPKWADHPNNFIKKYGYAHVRDLHGSHASLDDPLLGLRRLGGIPCA